LLKEGNMSIGTLHIVPSLETGEWFIRIDEVYTPFPNQGEAIVRAWELVKDLAEAEVLIHGEDGRVRSSLTVRQFDEDIQEAEDAALRVEAERITPSADRLRAMIARRPASTIDYSLEDDELPC
jgi:Uncharacterized protein conserved in bacteria (DUF2188)